MHHPPLVQRRIIVAIDASLEYGRGIIGGIVAYSRGVGHWTLELQTRGGHRYGQLAGRGDIDGILMIWPGDVSIGEVRHRVVNVGDNAGRSELPTICVDNRRVGELAAEHLLERGFERFAGFVLPAHEGSLDRYAGFAETVEAAGYRCRRYAGSLGPGRLMDWLRRRRRGRPLGVMAFADGYALQLAEAAWTLGWAVPDELGIVGVDNDPLSCESGHVSLSSVAQPLHRIGYEAARRLDGWIEAGVEPPGDRSLLEQLPPTGLVVRASSDTWVTGDEKVAAALALFREGLTGGVTVGGVAEAVGLGRRQLERRFKREVGRTINQVLTRGRLDRARMLLATTDDSVGAVAGACGFGSVSYFCKIFRQHSGQRPVDYRRAISGRWTSAG